jgi:hypothetical protein
MTLDDRIFIVKLFRLALKTIAFMPLDRELHIPYDQQLGQAFKEKTDQLLMDSK